MADEDLVEKMAKAISRPEIVEALDAHLKQIGDVIKQDGLEGLGKLEEKMKKDFEDLSGENILMVEGLPIDEELAGEIRGLARDGDIEGSLKLLQEKIISMLQGKEIKMIFKKGPVEQILEEAVEEEERDFGEIPDDER